MLQQFNERRINRKERQKIGKLVKKEFIPLDGSLKDFFSEKRDGQSFFNYFRRMGYSLKFTLRSTIERMWYGQALRDYYDLDNAILIIFRNGLLALSKLSCGYDPRNFSTYEEWIAELTRMTDYLTLYLNSNDGKEKQEMWKEISQWMTNYLPSLWD